MARDSYLLRIDPRIMAAIRRWSDDELRSINGQIEFLLREALKNAGRLPAQDANSTDEAAESPTRKRRGSES